MASLQKLQKLHSLLLQCPTGISRARIERELGMSKATTYRIIYRLKDELGAPIVDAGRTGFIKYEEGKKFELPGFWLSDGEIGALLGLTMWVTGSESSVISDVVQPLKKRLDELTQNLGINLDRLELVAVLHMNSRSLSPGILRAVCEGLLERRGLRIRHGEKGEEIEREISPQKLVRYRDNWYLDAFCHLRNALRSFALFRVSNVQLLNEKVKVVSRLEFQEHFTTSYGIFGGTPKYEAVLRFKGYAAKYVEGEKWHSHEIKTWIEDKLILKFPYGDSRELVLDIMKWGPEVEVLGPDTLRDEVGKLLQNAADLYRPK